MIMCMIVYDRIRQEMYIDMKVLHFLWACSNQTSSIYRWIISMGFLVRWRRALIVDVKNFRTILYVLIMIESH